MQNLSDFIMKCAIFEEHSSSCVVYSRFGGTLFPVSMIDGDLVTSGISEVYKTYHHLDGEERAGCFA